MITISLSMVTGDFFLLSDVVWGQSEATGWCQIPHEDQPFGPRKLQVNHLLGLGQNAWRPGVVGGIQSLKWQDPLEACSDQVILAIFGSPE